MPSHFKNKFYVISLFLFLSVTQFYEGKKWELSMGKLRKFTWKKLLNFAKLSSYFDVLTKKYLLSSPYFQGKVFGRKYASKFIDDISVPF